MSKVKYPQVTTGAVAWLLAVPLQAGSAQAQTAANGSQIKEIVVTAEHRVTTVQKTAISITVRTGSELKNEGRYTLGQILEDVPGVSGGSQGDLASGASGSDDAAHGLTIRGMVSNTGSFGNVTTVASAAALYVDGVYDGVGGGYDIDRVEILRGPQGTLYGRSATSGLVAIHTADPNLTRPGLDASVEAGNYGLLHYAGMVNIPLVKDVLGIRVAGNRYERNGYFSTSGGALATNDAKIKLLYKPNDVVSALVGAALEDNVTHSGGSTITLSTPNTYLYTPTPVGTGSNSFRQIWASLNWNLGLGTLTYLPAYRTWKSVSLAASRGDFGSINTTLAVPRDHFNTQELRLASNPDSKLIWQLGGLYYDNSLASHEHVELFPSGLVAIDALVRSKTTTAEGVFAEGTYPVADGWRVTGGVRYDHTKVAVVEDYTSITGVTQTLSGADGIRTFNNVTYKARLEHDLTPRNLVYASVSTGFSPGDVSVTTSPTGDPYALQLNAETLTAYEIGSKNRFLDNRLQVNGAVYYYDYGAYQTANIDITPNSFSGTYATLAAPARMYGGELETTFRLTPDDRIGLNLAYTDAYFVDKNTLISTGQGTSVTFGEFFAHDKIPGVVPFTANVPYDHTVELPDASTLTLHGSVRYMSGHALSNVTTTQLATGYDPYFEVGGQWVGDVSATWLSPNGLVSVTGYVRNIGNNQYKTMANPELGNAVLSTPYDPRTYGAIFDVHF